MIDYFMYDAEVRKFFTDIKVIRGAEIDTDHPLLVAYTKILRDNRLRRKTLKAIKVRELDNPEKRAQYTTLLEESIRRLDYSGVVEEQ